MVKNFVQETLQTENLHNSGILTWSSRHNKERQLAKKLKIDFQSKLSDEELKNLQAERNKEIIMIRSKLKKATSKKIKLKPVEDLEKESIQKMRKYESELRKQLKIITQTIKDSHNLILLEQHQTTHDVATIITFLNHFIELVEINFTQGDLSGYIPEHFQLQLRVLIQEAKSELEKIETETENAISSEFNLHNSIKKRSNNRRSKKDLSTLIQERTEVKQRLFQRLNQLTIIFKELENSLILIQKHAKLEPQGVFLPKLSIQSTHLSVNLTLLEDSVQSAIMSWPADKELRQTIRKEATEIYSQIYDYKLAFEDRINEQKKSTQNKVDKKHMKHHSKLKHTVKTKKQLLVITNNRKIIHKISQIMQRSNPTKQENEESLLILKQYLREDHEKLQDVISELSQKTYQEGKLKTEIKHKESVLKKFIKAISIFQNKMHYFYKQIHQRLQYTTDIIVSSLTIQQQLAHSLIEIQTHLKKFYRTLNKEHSKIIINEKSQYKKKLHQKFVKELISKEELFDKEIKELEKTLGNRIKSLLEEIPRDQIEEKDFATIDVKDLKNTGSHLSKSFQTLASVIGATQ